MAIRTGWVGSSAKAETGKAWVSEARVEVRLPRAGWMSEMIGRSKEMRFISTVNRTQANIYELMGSPTEPNIYIFENTGTISAATQSGWALQTGTFPAGSTLTIINRGHIRGGGGNGGAANHGAAGGTALILNFPTTIDNTGGTIWGGGGGGGGLSDWTGTKGNGGGGAGIPSGTGHAAGSATDGGAGRGFPNAWCGAGGSVGNAGGTTTVRSHTAGVTAYSGGRGGYSVQANGNAVSWIAAGDRKGSVV